MGLMSCRPKLKFAETHLDWLNLACFEFLEHAASLFLYFDLLHLEHCLIKPKDLEIYI